MSDNPTVRTSAKVVAGACALRQTIDRSGRLATARADLCLVALDRWDHVVARRFRPLGTVAAAFYVALLTDVSDVHVRSRW